MPRGNDKRTVVKEVYEFHKNYLELFNHVIYNPNLELNNEY